jgi:spore maturation protein CgeB
MHGIIVGEWRYDIYEKALADGLERQGVNIIKFSTLNYVKSQLQKKIRNGPQIRVLNKKFIQFAKHHKPDFIFFQRNQFFYSKTIKIIQKKIPDIVLLNYHNDNPFVHKHKWLKHRHFLRSIKCFDINYAYRPSNISDLIRYGSIKTKLLLPYFIDGLHNQEISVNKEYDVIFMGHYENDGRDDFINYLIKNGINVKVFGDKLWKKSKIPKMHISSGKPRLQYVKTLKKSKIALAFYSKINNDVFTRRCFEIPASKTLLMAKYSEALSKIYEEDTDIVMFRDKLELLSKVRELLYQKDQLNKIAINGYYKCVKNHSNVQRSKEILNDVSEIKKEKNLIIYNN